MVTQSDLGHSWPQVGIAVLDTNTCIELKRRLPIRQQWQFFLTMTSQIRNGKIAFPRQVREELIRIEYPDVPGAWAAYAFAMHPNSLAIPDDAHTRAIRTHYYPSAGQATDEVEPADPYVVGLALTLRSKGFETVVASEDRTVVRACLDHGIGVTETEQLIRSIRSIIKPTQRNLIE